MSCLHTIPIATIHIFRGFQAIGCLQLGESKGVKSAKELLFYQLMCIKTKLGKENKLSVCAIPPVSAKSTPSYGILLSYI